MSKILITGGNSFIGQSICPFLISGYHEISKAGRQELDVTNLKELKDYLLWFKPEFVIHTAVRGNGSEKDTEFDSISNFKMMANLHCLNYLYNKIILLDSGASFDRQTNIFNRKEGDFRTIPDDRYGYSKYYQYRLFSSLDKTINLRIFNIFGPLELERRFIKSTIKKCLNNENIQIFEDKFFSFFSIWDFATLIQFLVSNQPTKYIDLNCCYTDYFKLSNIAQIIKEKTKSKSKIIIDKNSELNYNGNGDKLYSMGINLLGIDKSLTKMIESINGK